MQITNASEITHTHKYTDKEMMEMRGHKSVQHLTVYQRVKNDKKIEMAKSLNMALKPTDDQINDVKKDMDLKVQAPKSIPILPKPTQFGSIPYEPN